MAVEGVVMKTVKLIEGEIFFVCTDTIDHPDQFETNPCYTLELTNVRVVATAIGQM